MGVDSKTSLFGTHVKALASTGLSCVYVASEVVELEYRYGGPLDRTSGLFWYSRLHTLRLLTSVRLSRLDCELLSENLVSLRSVSLTQTLPRLAMPHFLYAKCLQSNFDSICRAMPHLESLEVDEKSRIYIDGSKYSLDIRLTTHMPCLRTLLIRHITIKNWEDVRLLSKIQVLGLYSMNAVKDVGSLISSRFYPEIRHLANVS